ncbi:MAG: hypothetical protein QW478_01155 [Candidatus Micrarchaeaceae archaeon]
MYTKDENIYLFDNGKIRTICKNVWSYKVLYGKFLMFEKDDLFVFDSVKNTLTKVNIDKSYLNKMISYSINLSNKIAFISRDDIYLLDNKVEKLYVLSESDETLYSVDWLDNDNLLLLIESSYFHMPVLDYFRFEISNNELLGYNNNPRYYIIRNKYNYFYNTAGFYISEKLTGDVVKHYFLSLIGFDVSYDEKLGVYSVRDKVIVINFETDEKEEFNISDVKNIKISFDDRYLLLHMEDKTVNILDMKTKNVIKFALNVDFICWML